MLSGIAVCVTRNSVPWPSGHYRREAIGAAGAVAHLTVEVVAPALERAALLLRALFSACSAADGPWDLLPRLLIRTSTQNKQALASRGARGST